MNKNMKVVVIGGTGLIGSKVVNLLRQRGDEVVAASPSSGVNTLTGEGLAEALKGAQVVVDVANSPSFEDKPAMDFFETSGRSYLGATGDARKVLTDAKAGYFGITVNDQSLVPGDDPRLGPTHYDDWLKRSPA